MALAAIAVQGAGLALPALWLALPVALVAFAVGGAGHGAKNAIVRTLVHVRVPPEARGRAWGAYAAGRNGAELVALTGGGLLVAALGPRWTLLAAGALPMLVVAVAAAQNARYRWRLRKNPCPSGFVQAMPSSRLTQMTSPLRDAVP